METYETKHKELNHFGCYRLISGKSTGHTRNIIHVHVQKSSNAVTIKKYTTNISILAEGEKQSRLMVKVSMLASRQNYGKLPL